MVVKFYYHPLSPPARSVHFTLKSLNVPFEPIILDLVNKEHKSEDFCKINPEGSVPTIVDDGFVIVDSHAINIYLVNKFGKDDKLYPKDLKEQSEVNHVLFLDASEVFAALKRTVKSFPLDTVFIPDDKVIELFENTYEIVEKLAGKTQYICGNSWTIADFSIVSSITSMNEMIPVNKEKFPSLISYLELCSKNLPHYAEVNEAGLEEWKKYLKAKKFQAK
ncbi:hypothetical protein V9T40_013313 [Parthenolecanium corni]|uniref:Glutathione S-transferase n=1 Tax=Parthenolecanium corni TaxID=536013 RepID=A0AAN9TYR4_9HEMI